MCFLIKTMIIFFRGEDKEDEKAFRKWFSYIGELRSIFPSASILALSATCTKTISNRVCKVLQMSKGMLEVRISPDRPNIKLVVSKVPNTIEMSMAWILDGITESYFPRTILYCKSIKDASSIYSYLNCEIPESASKIEMFHSETPDFNKNFILDSLKQPDSSLQLVIATSALGMGVDISNIHNVILFGAPRSMVDLVQAIGRVGRDGEESTACLLYNSYHLRNVDQDVKDMFKSADCRRLEMLSPFLSSSEIEKLEEGDHLCCDLCASKCHCGHCPRSVIEKLLFFIACDDDDNSSSDEDRGEHDVEFDPLDVDPIGVDPLDDDPYFEELDLSSLNLE